MRFVTTRSDFVFGLVGAYRLADLPNVKKVIVASGGSGRQKLNEKIYGAQVSMTLTSM